MLKALSRIVSKFYSFIYKQGYAVDLSHLETSPNFSEYHLEELGTWLSKRSEVWVCLSSLKQEEFKEFFFEMTHFPREEVSIKKRAFPFVLFYG